MHTITGVTGHVGTATARALLQRDVPVRAVVRDAAKAAPWERRGAETALADFDDRAALAEALRGSDGAFLMLPTVPAYGDVEHRRMADSIAGAVADSGVPHVVLLSSVGAELPEGTGPIRWLHHLEARLRETGALLSAIRSCHFQEKVEAVLGAALEAGVYPVFGETADLPFPMVATRDVGTLAAETLLAGPPPASEVIDLEGPAYSEREVAERLAFTLGKPLQVVLIPPAGWIDALVEAGLPAAFAHELAGLHEAERRGILRPCGDRRHAGATRIEQTLRRLVDDVASQPCSVGR